MWPCKKQNIEIPNLLGDDVREKRNELDSTPKHPVLVPITCTVVVLVRFSRGKELVE